MKILAVIPARGGSKGIPRKNVRLMAGKPLIYYAISNAGKCSAVTDVVVTSDDDEILNIAENYGAVALTRSPGLAGDAVTLDPVICDAVKQMESRRQYRYDIVVTLQATSPVLKSGTLNEAIKSFIETGAETYISAVNKPHLSWGKNENGYDPLYEKRLNRQQLPPNYLEAGAFLITRREFVTENSRMGSKISVYEIPEDEAVDIDAVSDWVLCESVLSRKKIVLRADGYKLIGMGHIYHCLTLAYNLIGHDIMLVTKKGCGEGIKKLEESHLPYKVIADDNDFIKFLTDYKPDIIVNDCLDTDAEYIKRLKNLCPRVVTIEDMGEGAAYADVVINALYSGKNDGHIYSGEDYICLRDEFIIAEPKDFSPKVLNMLALFGGTDPSNLTLRIYDMAKKLHSRYPDIKFTFITGLGYDCEKNGVVSLPDCNIEVIRDVKFVSPYMKRADLAFTSQGRTVYEFASLGVPAVVLAQNSREQLHAFAQMENGFFNLGLGSEVSTETIERTFEFLVSTPQVRESMRRLMLSHERQLKSGVEREVSLILGK